MNEVRGVYPTRVRRSLEGTWLRPQTGKGWQVHQKYVIVNDADDIVDMTESVGGASTSSKTETSKYSGGGVDPCLLTKIGT